MIEVIKIPDVGGGDVEVIEVAVAVGDTIAVDDSLLVLESDKASMEVPSPVAGVVTALSVAEGDTVKEGLEIMQVEVAAGETAIAAEPAAEPEAPPTPQPEPVSEAAASELNVTVPDIGGEAEVVELSVAVGDTVAVDDTVCVLESDKASMEVPSPQAGIVKALHIEVGDKVSQGAPMLVLATETVTAPAPQAVAEPAAPAAAPAPAKPQTATAAPAATDSDDVYAGPAVRKLAREMGVNLAQIHATGPRGRILKTDLQQYVQQAVSNAGSAMGGAALPELPVIDFSQFGSVREEKQSRIQKLTAQNMQRSWLNIPHVTQFDDIDISELETFRQAMKTEAAEAGVKLTPLPFLLKACAVALRQHPVFNSSLAGDKLVFKDYVHIGIAVDTPAGLMVPVLRDVDKKGIYQLAQESTELATAAKARQLKPGDMQGGCFTISSLGGIGGRGFTPIINPPEVAILGVSRLATQAVWNGSEFAPRQLLPVALSYDHRVVNGADAGRFLATVMACLQDVRRLLL